VRRCRWRTREGGEREGFSWRVLFRRGGGGGGDGDGGWMRTHQGQETRLAGSARSCEEVGGGFLGRGFVVEVEVDEGG
jgi:hypothetical protein